MARLPGIPEKLAQQVLDKNAEGWSGEKISDWLEQTHQLKVSLKCIRNCINKKIKARQLASANAVSKAIADHVTSDLSILQDKVARLDSKVVKALEDDDPEKVKIYGDLLFKFLARKLDLSAGSGSSSLDEAEKAAAWDRLKEKLGK